ncbi:MAG: hypothetical protein FWC03_11295 [Treponema sp.]|nr:hypothetical protein [Treponema sp.]
MAEIYNREVIMLVLGIILGIAIFGATSYMAVNKKSNFLTRLVCLGALAVMILTVIICMIIVFTDDTVVIDPSTLIVGEPVEVKEEDSDLFILIFTITFFLILFAVILFLAMREHKRGSAKK